MDGKFTYDVSEEAEKVDDDGGPSETTAIFLSAVEGISNARKYLMRFHVENKMMAALSSIEYDYTLFSTK